MAQGSVERRRLRARSANLSPGSTEQGLDWFGQSSALQIIREGTVRSIEESAGQLHSNLRLWKQTTYWSNKKQIAGRRHS